MERRHGAGIGEPGAVVTPGVGVIGDTGTQWRRRDPIASACPARVSVEATDMGPCLARSDGV
ncbi:hypothetical protein GCM10022253_00880 [Sphingomonas endophytica]